MQTAKDYLHVFLDMGDALLNSGAEIFRVEDTLNRMGYACGATQMNVFVITSSIVITMEFPGDGARTQTRRVREDGGNDFTKLEQLNDLSRRFCRQPVSATELRKNLIRSMQTDQSHSGNFLEAFWRPVVLHFLWWKYFGCDCGRTWGCFDLGITAIFSTSVYE